ncbi:MAG: hypothetical protein E7523_02835 [Ruminococcaceae bacterium]|nr:hypothetical protein [Oscillospiraceae bacterium]
MDPFLKDQIINSIKYIPTNIVKSYFTKTYSDETKAIRKKLGFIRGACHVSQDYEQVKHANIEWIRTDVPFPFDKNGNVRDVYTKRKEEFKTIKATGLKIMAMTAIPSHCTDLGIDPRTAEGKKLICKAARFTVEDLQGVIDGIQVANEIGMPRFTVPLNMKEGIEFIGMQLKAMYDCRGNIIIGYNSAGPQADLHAGLKPYHKFCDYVGLDMYLGCFFHLPGFMFLFNVMARYLWAFTKKPILMQEFGYISDGKPKTKAEKKEILHSYGFDSEKAARENITQFVENLPKHFGDHVKYVCEGDASKYADFLFNGDMTNHLYKELPAITVIPGYPHTPEGQAKFYTKLLDRFYNLDFICGAIVFCYTDFPHCAYCGQSDCPTETRWGLVDNNGKPKPSYYAVQKAFESFRNKDKAPK